jgi:hypothetical protein
MRDRAMKYRSVILAAAVALCLPAGLLAADAAQDQKAMTKPVAASEVKTGQAAAKPADAKATCEYVTGSRIKHAPPVDCDQAAPGLRSYTAEDLQNTGHVDIAEALRWLDPRFQ